jgi:hypothetical protein
LKCLISCNPGRSQLSQAWRMLPLSVLVRGTCNRQRGLWALASFLSETSDCTSDSM